MLIGDSRDPEFRFAKSTNDMFGKLRKVWVVLTSKMIDHTHDQREKGEVAFTQQRIDRRP